MDIFIKGLRLLILGLILYLPKSLYAAPPVEAYQLKAVFVYNFAHFVSFPETLQKKDSRFTFCTFGKGRFSQALQLILEQQNFAGAPPQLIHLDHADSPQVCQIVYFSQHDNKDYHELLSTLQGLSILTVSDIKGFIQQGGMIEFVRIENKINLLINNKRALAVNLSIKANLLDIATLIDD